MWYIVEADPDASLVFGFKKKISVDEFRERIENNTLLDAIESVPVKAGDVFFIEAGTLHAIGKGLLIAEIQQNSNSTYRVYDFGRVGADGKPRELHIDKAIDVTKLEPTTKREIKGNLIADCNYFKSYKYNIKEPTDFDTENKTFNAILCTSGAVEVTAEGVTVTVKKGESVFITEETGRYQISGNGTILLSTK